MFISQVGCLCQLFILQLETQFKLEQRVYLYPESTTHTVNCVKQVTSVGTV